MDWRDRIMVDPKVLVGKPVVKETRIAVELVVQLFAAGWTREEILDSYPTLKPEDNRACLAHADENFPRPAIVALREAGLDLLWMSVVTAQKIRMRPLPPASP